MYQYGKKYGKCFKCDKVFNLEYLNDHIKFVHQGIKNHECYKCGKAFSHQKSLIRHISSIHEKPNIIHKCVYCGKTFRLKTEVKTHTMDVHLQCNICCKYLISPQNLEWHMKKCHEVFKN